MIRRPAALAVLVLAAVAALAPAGAAGAASDDEIEDLTRRYDLVRTRDLPDGYELVSVRRESGGSAGYLEVQGRCAALSSRQLLGSDPVTARAEFERSTSGSLGGAGKETVFTFDDTDTANEYYTRFAAELEELVRCGTMTDALGHIGTYAKLGIGKAGDARTALSFDPRADRYTRLALARDDERVVYVELYDDGATDAEFTALVAQAVKRAR